MSAPRIAAALLLAVAPASRLIAQDSLPAKPPAPTPLSPVRFPPFRESTLPNGLSLLVIENHEQPTVSVSLSFPAGETVDPAGKEGLSELVAELLTKGTPTRTAEQIAASIEGVGGSLSAGAGQDFFTINASTLTEHVGLAFELMGDAIRHANFPAAELELARTRYLSQLQLNLSQPDFLADRFFDREIYGSHFYGRGATPESYALISRDDVVKFAADRLKPRGAMLVVAGDITPAQARTLVLTHFAGWQGASPVVTPPATPPAKTATDILLIHRPGSVQANIVIGNTTFLPRDTGYYAARIATQVLGGGADARLFMILREQKSWTYGSYASLNRARDLGNWQATAEVRTEVTDSALAEMLHQIDRIRTEAIPDSELMGAKGFLVGVFPLTIETPSQIASQVASVRLLGLPTDYLQTYRDRLAAVSPAAARAAAQRVYRRSALTIVVVGDAMKLYDKLKAIAPVRLVDVDGKAMSADDLMPKAGPLALDQAQITARRDSFRVVIQGTPYGTQTGAIRRTTDSLVYVEDLSIPVAGMMQSTKVAFDPRTVTVRQVDQTGRAGNQPSEIHLKVDGGRVRGTAQVPQQSGTPRSVTIDTAVTAWTYLDNALSVVIPALPLEAGKTFAIETLSSGDGTIRVMTVKVGAVENVTVPAGTFPAYRIELAGGQAPILFYVSTTTPRRIVKIDVPTQQFMMELVK